jgi:hypothetical protein
VAEQVGAVELLAELLGADDAVAEWGVVDLPGDEVLAVGRAGVVALRRPEQSLLAHREEGEERLLATGLPDAHGAIP